MPSGWPGEDSFCSDGFNQQLSVLSIHASFNKLDITGGHGKVSLSNKRPQVAPLYRSYILRPRCYLGYAPTSTKGIFFCQTLSSLIEYNQAFYYGLMYCPKWTCAISLDESGAPVEVSGVAYRDGAPVSLAWLIRRPALCPTFACVFMSRGKLQASWPQKGKKVFRL